MTNTADAHLDRAILSHPAFPRANEYDPLRNLPFVDGFFDAILCVDSYVYFGTDDHFLNYILKFLAPGGTLAVAHARTHEGL